jgi:hypothetical protein
VAGWRRIAAGGEIGASGDVLGDFRVKGFWAGLERTEFAIEAPTVIEVVAVTACDCM